MIYYEVAIGGKLRGDKGIFTFCYPIELSTGQCVGVQLQNKKVKGFVVKQSAKPDYDTSTIETIDGCILPKESVAAYLALTELYPMSEYALANLFLPPTETKRHVQPAEIQEPAELPELNDEQRGAYKVITEQRHPRVILHGETGSGKTRLYCHLLRQCLEEGRNAILLAPEIGLAQFLHDEVARYFPATLLYHSALSGVERSSIWRYMLGTQTQDLEDANIPDEHDTGGPSRPYVVIGPRSALGLPHTNLGLIILDEAHDQSYRQDNAPFVHAKILASVLAEQHGACVVYGSATPLVSDYYTAESLELPIVRMSKLAVQKDVKAEVHIAAYDDVNERASGHLLKSSRRAIETALRVGAQSLVLINRRGTARYIACDACGSESRCTTCERLLTYHHDSYQLRCHHCQKNYSVPSICADCGKTDIKMRSFGAKAIVDQLSREYPEAVIRRFDTDNDKKDHLLNHLENLRNGKIDIIVGTQMIAKGLDLPKLRSLVVLGSSGSSGYMSEEREFELLYQVLGRAMRGHRDSEVVIQTANPRSRIVRYASERDYAGFYQHELRDREVFMYPPYCYMMLVHIRRKTSDGAKGAGESLHKKLDGKYPGVSIGAPTPNTTERVGMYRHWHVLIKAKKRSLLVAIAKKLGSGYRCELDPLDLP